MNDDRLQQLLAAERAAGADGSDDIKNAAIVDHLRSIAGVGIVGALTASTAAQAATPATGLATGSVAGFGLAKVVAVVVVAASAAVSVVVLGPPATESVAARPQAASPPNPLSLQGEGEPATSTAAQRPASMTPAPAAVSIPPLPPGRGSRGVRQAAEPAPQREAAAAGDGPSSSPPPAPSSLPAYDAAEAALRAGRFDDAANAFSWWLKDHPVDVLRPEAALSLIEALYRAHRYDELIAATPAALVDVDASRHGDVERLRAEALVQLQRCDDAEVVFAKARRAHARDLDDDDVSAALSACRAASPR